MSAQPEHWQEEVPESKEPQPLDQPVRAGVDKLNVSSVLMVVWSGIALASDGYNSQALGSVNAMFKKLYGDEYSGEMKGRVSSAYYVGLCLGSFAFGLLIDHFSRKTGVVFATALMIIGVALCTGSYGPSPHMMFWMLTVSRGILGFGAGGEYPVCSTGSTEAGDETNAVRKHRGLIVGLVGCTAVDFGIVFGGLLPLCILAGFGYNSSTPADETMHLKAAWRITLGLGCIIPATVFFFRYRMASSTAFKNHSMTKGMSLRVYMLVVKRYWRQIIGTCLTWFLYDFVAYPFGLFTPNIIDGLPGNSKNLIVSIGYSALINSFNIPGCILGSFALDRIGRRNTMLLGFVSQSMIAFVLAGALAPIQTVMPLFIILYGIMLSCGEFGPGVTTLLVSSECFPTAFRGHFVGLAASVAKAGAAVGTVLFNRILAHYATPEEDTTTQGLRVVVFVSAGLSLLGALITFMFIPGDHDRNLQNEDIRFREFLMMHGVSSESFDEPDAYRASSFDDFLDDKPVVNV